GRAVAARLEDRDGVDPGAAAVDADLAHDLADLRLDRHEHEAPLRFPAAQLDTVEAVQRAEVAGESRADALDERPEHRVVGQIQHALRPALDLSDREPLAVEDERFGRGLRRLLLEV